MSIDQSNLDTAIGEVMGQVLVREPLSADEDFFDCGGDSLRAVEVLQRLVEQHQALLEGPADQLQAVLLEAIFEDATPAGLAAVVTAHRRRPAPAGPGH
jgi:aryl carrier-like protein